MRRALTNNKVSFLLVIFISLVFCANSVLPAIKALAENPENETPKDQFLTDAAQNQENNQPVLLSGANSDSTEKNSSKQEEAAEESVSGLSELPPAANLNPAFFVGSRT